MRIHVLGIAGGILGLVSLGFAWLAVPVDGETTAGSAFKVFDLITLLGPSFDASPGMGVAIILMVVGVLLAVIGTIAAFLHPVGGGFLVAAGITGTIGGLWAGATLSVVPGASASLGIGVVLCLAAGAVALGGYGMPALTLWPRQAAATARPVGPATSSGPLADSPPSKDAESPALPPPPPPDAVFVPYDPTPGVVTAPSAGWVAQLEREMRGIDEAIVGERTSLSRIEVALANGEIDNPTYVELSRDHSSRIAVLERHLARKRLERESGEEPPPPPD